MKPLRVLKCVAVDTQCYLRTRQCPRRSDVIDSLWTRLCFPKQLCIAVVYASLCAVVGVRWKPQTLACQFEVKDVSGTTLLM